MKKLFIILGLFVCLVGYSQQVIRILPPDSSATPSGVIRISSGMVYSTNNTYYVRPPGGDYGDEDGTSYVNAWDGSPDANIVEPGDTIYLCDTFPEFEINLSGNINNQVVFKGNYPGHLCVIDCEDTRESGMIISNKNYITLDSIKSIDATVNCLLIEGTSTGIITYDFIGTGVGNQGMQHLNQVSATHNDPYLANNTDDGISSHDTCIIVVNGGTFINNAQAINIIENSHLTITGDVTFTDNGIDMWATQADADSSCWIYADLDTIPVLAYASGQAKITIYNAVIDSIRMTTNGRMEIHNSLINNIYDNDLNGNISLYKCRVMDYFVADGRVIAEHTFFNGGDEHFVDVDDNEEGYFKYCIFNGMAASKFGIAARAGATITVDNCTFVGASNVGRGLYTVADLTANNNIFTDLEYGYFRANPSTSITYNCCFYDNTTDVQGTVTQNNSITTDPKLISVSEENFQLLTGSSCIGAGVDLGSSYNTIIDTADWGNGISDIPYISTSTQPDDKYIGACDSGIVSLSISMPSDTITIPFDSIPEITFTTTPDSASLDSAIWTTNGGGSFANYNYYTTTYTHAAPDSANGGVYLVGTAYLNGQTAVDSFYLELCDCADGDVTAPELDSIQLGTLTDSTFILFFSELLLEDSIPDESDFNITEEGNVIGLTSTSISGDTLLIVADSICHADSTYLVDYTQGNTIVQDTANNNLESFSDSSVVNTIAGAGGAEMITNGGFGADTDWDYNEYYSISGGDASFDGVSLGILRQADGDMVSSVETSTDYTIEFDLDVTGATANFIIMNYTGSVTYVALDDYATGNHSVGFTTPADVDGAGLQFYTGTDSAFDIDNVSLTAD